MSDYGHTPILVNEVLALIEGRHSGVFADTTLGRGGHAEAILEATAPDGRLIGLDRDASSLAVARERLSRFAHRTTLVQAEFSRLGEVLGRCGHPQADLVLADLGVSSPQLDDAERGFSFMREGPLDMRMDPSKGESAAEFIDRLSERELADVIYQYGEERRSRPIARSIRRAHDDGVLHTTTDLRRAVVRATGPKRSGGVDPATRTFQALRIAVNGELDELAALLEQLPDVLSDEGIAAILSFHSMEDRMVKRAFRGDERLSPMTRRPVIASDEEVARNPRARSAKLRAACRVPREVAA